MPRIAFPLSRFAFVVALTLAMSSSALQAQVTSWVDNNSGSWTNSANWTNGVPTAGGTALIDIGDVIQDTVGGTTVTNLTYGFGTSTLDLQTDLDVVGALNWTGGKILGSAALNLSGTATIEDGDLEGTVNSTADVDLDSFVFFDGSSGTGVWNNLSGSTFNLVDDANLAFDNTFNNQAGAVFRKLNAADDARMSWNLNSTGLIQVDGGTLLLLGDAFIDGEVQIANGATLDFNTIKDYSFGANAVVNGAGVLEWSAGTTTINNTLVVNSGLRLDGTGDLVGSGTLNINGFLDWDSSFSMEGTGVTNVLGNSQIGGGTLERTLNNHGNVDFQPTTFLAGAGASTVWNNRTGATFDIGNDQGLAFDGAFNNDQGATFVKSGGTGTSTISWDVTNNGIVEAGSGTLWFTGDFLQGGTGELRLSGGQFRFNNFLGSAGGSISGSGTIDSSFARVTGTLDPGNLDFTGDLVVTSAATMDFDLGTGQDLVNVTNDLILDGTLNVFELPGFGVGSYTLFNYGGSFTDNSVALGTLPAGYNYELFHDVANMSFLLNVSAVPEPGSMAFLLAAAFGLGCKRRKKLVG